ncbi:MAG: efflux RND transporter periplasmic adaptor subunit [Anaerolineales bacterium]|jgi:multidrug resistance efflux pump
MHPNPRKILPVFVLILVAGALWWYFSEESARAETASLVASGTIEANQVAIASEIGGNVADVLANKGELVESGQNLIRLDDAIWQAQLIQAQAALAQAQANYDMVAAGLPPQQREVAVAAAELELLGAQQTLDDLYDGMDLMTANAAKEVADARDLVRDAERIYEALTSAASENDIEIAEASLALVEAAQKRAEKALKRLSNKSETHPKRAAARLLVALLEKQHDLAVRRLNYLEEGADEITVAQAEANLELARANLEDAERKYDEVKDGIDPDTLALAQARLATAEANLVAAQAGPTPEQLAVAQSQIDLAQAAVDVLQVQMDKLVITSPIDGIVLSRSTEPGEVAAPGSPLITLARLEDLTITVYIAEDRYGTISIGQTARVEVDSFPGEVFEARVIRIADEAEFTPRNVQTEEGRRNTVFALELAVENPEGKLKPGMPADVDFGE